MRFARYGDQGQEVPVVIDHDDRAWDLRSIADDIDGAFLAGGGVDRTRDALRAGVLPAFAAEGARVAAPIARPAAVICIGQNYAAHAAESGAAPPDVPILFFKHPNTVVGPFDDVRIPPSAEKVDWEVELGIVIGRRTSYLDTVEEARSSIAGFVVSHDVSERAYQVEHSGGQWSKGKTAETFNPLGPWLVPLSDAIGADGRSLRLRSWVNGEARQDSFTSDMIFSPEEIVLHLSRYMVLEPGDLINTGTPEGVAFSGRFEYLRAGDVVELEIEGLGRQRQTVVGSDD